MGTRRERAGQRMRAWVALTALTVGALTVALAGCIASSSASDEGESTADGTDQADEPKLKGGLKDESTSGGAEDTTGVASTGTVPSTTEPQPSPWIPNPLGGRLSGLDPATAKSTGSTGNGPGSGQGRTPQPSPWHGFNPPPGETATVLAADEANEGNQTP